MRRLLLLAGVVLAAPAARAQSTCTPEHAAMGHCTSAPAPSASETPATGHPADVRFMQMMIPHHHQALEMTALVALRTDSPALRSLAERIETGQQQEIGWMSRWLRRHGQAPDAHAGHLMDGMLSPAQMADLEAARGDAFVHKFSAYMIQHHEGALAMVDTLRATPGGAQRADVHQIATDIEADQRADLLRLRALRDAVPATPLVPPAPTSAH